MVKGISRQVIVVASPDEKLFEQAIFILKDSALGEGVTQEKLMQEAKRAIRGGEEGQGRRRHVYAYGAFWAIAGALVVGLAWLVTAQF